MLGYSILLFLLSTYKEISGLLEELLKRFNKSILRKYLLKKIQKNLSLYFMKSILIEVSPVNFFILFGSLFSWIMGIGQLIIRKKSASNYLAAIFFFLIGTWQFFGACVFMGIAKHFPFNVYAISVPAYFLSIPLLYFYFLGIIDKTFKFSKIHLLNFLLPFMAMIIIIMISSKIVDFYYIMGLTKLNLKQFNEIVFSGVLYASALLSIIYLSIILRKLIFLKNESKDTAKKIFFIPQCWVYILLALIIFWIIDRMYSLEMLNLVYVIISIIIISFYLLSNRYPEFLFILQVESEKIRYGKSQIHNLNADEIILAIKKMTREKIFYNENLNLNSFATQLHITAHQLSEILNNHLKTNFPRFISGLRIEEARRLLINNIELRVIDVAMTVGFNSLSAFYNAFKKETGMSPLHYKLINSSNKK